VISIPRCARAAASLAGSQVRDHHRILVIRHLLQAWASAGYVVATVNFPRTDCGWTARPVW
jgi:hypothetical protein